MSEGAEESQVLGRLLLVAGRSGPTIRHFMDACGAAGWHVDVVEDVYAAMVRLVTPSDQPYDRVVVETPALHPDGVAFGEVARRYFPDLTVNPLHEFVPTTFDGARPASTESRRNGGAALGPVILDGSISEALGEAAWLDSEPANAHSAVSDEAPPPADTEHAAAPAASSDAPNDRVSARTNTLRVVLPPGTDPDAPDAAPAPDDRTPAPSDAPSLHEAVRQRMRAAAGADGVTSRPVKRIPPGSAPTGDVPIDAEPQDA
ncbi:MAG: hypothetical protein V3T70_08920, partial [Phycisphaerae bacterium]